MQHGESGSVLQLSPRDLASETGEQHMRQWDIGPGLKGVIYAAMTWAILIYFLEKTA